MTSSSQKINIGKTQTSNGVSKTPQFDRALDKILKDLKPYDKTCRQCGNTFYIFQEDIDFYHILRVPSPKLCPLCRKKRRFGHLMRVPKFFKRQCCVPGHKEELITVFPPDSPHRIYDFSYWHSDAWEATEFNKTYDKSRSFFEQFKELFLRVPHVQLERDSYGVDVEYTLGGTHGKNNYFSASTWHSQDCAYCIDVRYCRNMVDCTLDGWSELCYETLLSGSCHRCLFAVDCDSCIDSAFLYACKNCSHCFLSSNIRNKSYVFKNKQLTKEEYFKKIKRIDLGDRAVLGKYRKKFEDLYRRGLHRAVLTGRNNLNSICDSSMECKNCYFVFRTNTAENVRYSDNLEKIKDSMDIANGIGERFYESIAVLRGIDNRFSMYIRNCTHMEYSSECWDCHNCFGCAGLKNKKFHIFNYPYSELKYWESVDRIKTKMLKKGEYGEFFDLKLGLIPYQSSSGQYFFPLKREKAEKTGIPWYDEPASDIPPNIRMRQAPNEVPVRINEITDDILKDAIVCEKTGKPFRFTKYELDFYRNMHIPVPTIHPWQRMMERSYFEHRLELYPFTCPKCSKDSFSVYTPDEQKKMNILCEPCYIKKVI